MPIANCIVSPKCPSGRGDLTELWAKHAGVSSDEMTVNLVNAVAQQGKGYNIVATLYLPSLWSTAQREQLQIGLAAALSMYFEIPQREVLVVTHILGSGQVVEDGQVQYFYCRGGAVIELR